jgi:ribose transport system ATP-binding protein
MADVPHAGLRHGARSAPPWYVMTEATPIVEMRHFSKTFGATRALNDVDLDVYSGEIHALIGQNGSGKSTLVKILAGYHPPDEGAELLVGGASINLPLDPLHLDALGFTFVHQDLGLADTMSIVDNARVGAYSTGTFWRIRWADERSRVRRSIMEFGFDVNPDRLVGKLSVAERTIIAIVRALHRRSSEERPILLVLDEPTSYLPAGERNRLFKAMRRLADTGVAVIFVSHRIDEIEDVSDRVSVLRDGRRVGTWPTREIGRRELLRALVGRDLGELYPDTTSVAGEDVVLELQNVRHKSVSDISFQLHRGEILGLTGLLGMGHDDIPYLIYGSERLSGGRIIIDGAEHGALTPKTALALGVALLPGDRRRTGAIMGATISENTTMAVVRSYFVGGRISQSRERRDVLAVMKRFGVTPSSNADATMSSLSGGNQQKALFGKWLTLPNIRVLILHEPTQGVDVASRKLLFEYIHEAAAQGIAILYVSAEYEDLAHLCDRVIVMRSGRIDTELAGADVSLDRILERCYGVDARAQ